MCGPARTAAGMSSSTATRLPRVLVNQVYYTELSKTIRKDGDKSYFTDCLQNATWLVRALDQRARTILKVATEIVRQQDGFFTHGVAHLRPLNLKAVADAIQMHESTVSRVTANKYMATNRGSFELKYFFTASIASADGGEAHSAEAVRHHIKQLIDAEAASAILSDDTIVERLRESGIDIARRTVAKYREAMRIPSSVQRRRDKQSMLGNALSACHCLRPVPRYGPGLIAFAPNRDSLGSPPEHEGGGHGLPKDLQQNQSDRGKARHQMTLRISGKSISVGDALRSRVSERTDEVLQEIFRRQLFRPYHAEQGRLRLPHRLRAASGFRDYAGGRFQRHRCLCQRRPGAADDREAPAPLQEPAEGPLGPQDLCRQRGAGGDGGADADAPSYVIEAPAEGDEEVTSYSPVIIAEATTSLKRLSVSEAVMELDLTGAACIVFQHGSSGRVNIIYRRTDGNVGWVDPPAVTP